MRFRPGFMLIAWLYLALAAQYALHTPRWQVPDEPAHYNYIRTIATQATLPVLQAGDYDQAYLETLKRNRFPAELSIDTVRYESHQPPSYYLLAAPLYKLGEAAALDARLISLRLFSALWGVVLLALVYRIARLLFPADALLPLLAIALVAFVPQHLAMESGVNNDALAEVVLAAVMLGLLRLLGDDVRGAQRRRTWLAVGALAGFGLLTKTTTYISLVLIGVTLGLRWWQTPRIGADTRGALGALGIALLMGSLWFAHGALTYSPSDWLGLQRHNEVVVGQPRTLELYGSYAVAATYFFPTLFRSFWGQFGWMGVLLDARLYDTLFYFSAFALAGLVPFFAQARTTQRPYGRSAQLLLVCAWFIFMLIGTMAYSLEFFQAQGRYLFPALGAIALFMAMGLRAWLRLAAALSARLGAPAPVVEWSLGALLVGALVALDWIALYRFLIPQLR